MAPVRSGFAINPSSSPLGKISYDAPFGWNKLSHSAFAFFAGICAGGKKQESHWASQRQRLAYLMRVDWPAQPYMKPAQTI